MGPDFGDDGPIIQAFEAVAGGPADMHGGAHRSNGRPGGLSVGGAVIDADRAPDHFPEFLAAVVVLPGEAGFGGDKHDFGAKPGAGIIDAAAFAGEEFVDELFNLGGVDHKIAAPGPGEVLADKAEAG